MRRKSRWLLSSFFCTLPALRARPYAREIALVTLPPPVRGMCTNATMGFEGVGSPAFRAPTVPDSAWPDIGFGRGREAGACREGTHEGAAPRAHTAWFFQR